MKTKLTIGLLIILMFGTCISCFSSSPALGCIGSISSCVLGCVLSIILDKLDAHGHGFKLWWSSIKYRNEQIRISFSYLFRIEVDGKYLLVKGNRIKTQYQPIGGVYKYYTEAKSALEKFGYLPDTQMNNIDETDDLRISITGKYILSFMDWFLSMKDREYDPIREFQEELVLTGLLPDDAFRSFKYRKIAVHNPSVQFSKYLDCVELLYADIFELSLTENQKDIIRTAVKNFPDQLCLASPEELRKECYNGIERNIGNNATWIIGE